MLNSKEVKTSFFSDSEDPQQFIESGKFSESEKKIQNHKEFELFFAKDYLFWINKSDNKIDFCVWSWYQEF